jgi:hypothetical protein
MGEHSPSMEESMVIWTVAGMSQIEHFTGLMAQIAFACAQRLRKAISWIGALPLPEGGKGFLYRGVARDSKFEVQRGISLRTAELSVHDVRSP